MAPGTPEHLDEHFRQHIEAKYSNVAVDDREKLMEAIVGLIDYNRDQGQSLHSFLDLAAHVILRSLAFDEIIIGLYDRKENDYYNETVLGYKNDIAIELKRLRYSNEDLKNRERSSKVKIGKLSEFSLVEGRPKSERRLSDGSSVGSIVRKTRDEFVKGDFIEVWMRDPRMGIVGWIRVSHPRDSKFPPKINVLWLELISSICACVVSQRWHQEGQARGSADGV